jgi:hypothetical protein
MSKKSSILPSEPVCQAAKMKYMSAMNTVDCVGWH